MASTGGNPTHGRLTSIGYTCYKIANRVARRVEPIETRLAAGILIASPNRTVAPLAGLEASVALPPSDCQIPISRRVPGKHMARAQGRVADICGRLLDAFTSAVPLHPGSTKVRKRPSEKEIALATESGLKKFYEAARAEREQHRLGVIARARVAFILQQRLLAAGYPAPLVKQVLFAMLLSAFVGGRR